MILFLLGAYIMGGIIAFIITAFFTILGGSSITLTEFVLKCIVVAVVYPFMLLYFLAKHLNKN